MYIQSSGEEPDLGQVLRFCSFIFDARRYLSVSWRSRSGELGGTDFTKLPISSSSKKCVTYWVMTSSFSLTIALVTSFVPAEG